ncbi:hypothetical protein SELMODRAFT_96228, partial [Selaginella moellendorffii]
AAMAWGTHSCPKVDKILGPGNQNVTAAKMLLSCVFCFSIIQISNLQSLGSLRIETRMRSM